MASVSQTMTTSARPCLSSSFAGSRLPGRTSLSKKNLPAVKLTKTVMMSGHGDSSGIFAPIVILTRNIMGKKNFNQLRGKGIAIHSQVINEFCRTIGADPKQRQGLIRLAKKNGEKLGFLA